MMCAVNRDRRVWKKDDPKFREMGVSLLEKVTPEKKT